MAHRGSLGTSLARFALSEGCTKALQDRNDPKVKIAPQNWYLGPDLGPERVVSARFVTPSAALWATPWHKLSVRFCAVRGLREGTARYERPVAKMQQNSISFWAKVVCERVVCGLSGVGSLCGVTFE